MLIYGQLVLEADGPGNTYELINSAFAPGGTAVENPECVHPEFGRHIAEVWDAELNRFVFEFYMYVVPDNDRCINFDRQRIEIKTYESSPERLKGRPGETVAYVWKFRLPVGFQASSKFTHIHQIKAVGGDDGDPIFTLTPRKGNPNKMELIHNNSTKVVTVPLALFEGTWVECTEVLSIGAAGSYSMVIKKVSDGTTLLSYSNTKIMTIRADNDFVRPKWGIYRSLDAAADLRDEAVRFAGFAIYDVMTRVKYDEMMPPDNLQLRQNYPNPFNPVTRVTFKIVKPAFVRLCVYTAAGQEVARLVDEYKNTGEHTISFDGSPFSSGVYFYTIQSDGLTQTKKMLLMR